MISKFNPRFRGIVVLVAALTIFVSCHALDKMREADHLRKENFTLSNRIQELSRESTGLAEEKFVLEYRITQLEDTLAAREDGLRRLTEELAEVNRRRDELESALSARNDELNQRLNTAAEDRRRLEEDLRKLSEDHRKKSEEAALLKQTRAELADSRGRLAKLEERIARLQNEIDSKEVSLVNLRKRAEEAEQRHKEYVAAQSQEDAGLRRRLAELSTQKTALDSRLADARRELDLRRAAEERERERLKQAYEDLITALRSEVDAAQAEVTLYRGALTVSIKDGIFFNSGQADVKPGAFPILRSIAGVVKSLPVVQIEGHTDDVPIGPALRSRYRNNRSLGAARAISVAAYLEEAGHVDPTRIVVTSPGEYRPVVPNTSPENRARNRRIEILIVDRRLYELMDRRSTSE